MKRFFSPALMLAALTLLAGCGGSNNDRREAPPNEEELPSQVQSRQLNTTSSWTYFNLATGEQVNLSDEEAADSDAWHLAMYRYNIKLNGGTSGTGAVAAALIQRQEHFYNSDNTPNASVFTNTSAADQLNVMLADFDEPADNAWVFDRISSELRGSSAIDGGWYTYDMATGNMNANPNRGWLLRSGEGNSYARMRVTELDFPTRAGQGVKHFRIEFDVQPPGATQLTTAAVFEGSLPSGEQCFDFDSGAAIACSGNTWDLKIGYLNRDFFLRTNSGPSDPGDGGAFGPFQWTELATYTSATVTPGGEDIASRYTADVSAGIFVDHPWWEYNLLGQHKLWPNYRVYLVDTDRNDPEAPRYALQVTGYYNDAGESGHVRFRYRLAEKQ